MTVGPAVAAVRGIWSALGVEEGGARFMSIVRDGVGEITREFTEPGEHCSEQDRARFGYVFGQVASLLEQDNGVKRDIGHEGLTLADFVALPDARQAGLTAAHVLALRLYTSNSFGRINQPLRAGCTAAAPHPHAATAYYIHSGIMKLREVHPAGAVAELTYWRGMENMGVTDEFLRHGGTEMACMSTTEDPRVARTTFAKVGKVGCPLLLKVVSTDLTTRGADLSWLSMYPEEKEVLFPPLTYLLPVGEPVVADGYTVITVQPQF